MEIEIEINGKKFWFDADAFEAERKWREQQEIKLHNYWITFWRSLHDKIRKRREKNKRDLVFVFIIQGNTKKLAKQDKKTNRIYKIDKDYNDTWMEIKNYKFDRFCTSMDI